MAITGGPTVTLRFKGDTDDLERSIERIETWVTRIGLAGAGVAGVAAAGAAAAGLAIAGLPLLFAGIGIAAAAQSEKVKSAFTSLKDHVVAQAQAMAAPFEPILVGIANKAQATFDRIGPSLSRIFADVAPMVDRLADAVLRFIEGAMPGFERAIDNAKPVVDALARGIERMGPAIGDFFAKISEQSGPAAEAMDGLFTVITWLIGALGDALAFCLRWKDVLIPLGLTVASVAVGVKAVTLAIEAWRVAQIALNIVMAMNPVVAAIAIIAALAAGAIYCYQHFETFRNVVDSVWAAIKSAFTTGVDWMINAFQWFNDLPGKMSDWFGRAKDAAIDKLEQMIRWVADLPRVIFEALASLVTLLADRGRELITGLWDGAKAVFEQAVRWVADLPRMLVEAVVSLVTLLRDHGREFITGLWDGAKAVFEQVVRWVADLPRMLVEVVVSLATLLADHGREFITGLWDGAKAIFEQVVRWVADLPRMILNAIGDTSRALYSSGAGLMQGFADGINSKADAAKNAAGNVVGGTEALFPQSPPPEGPFSGAGWTYFRGESLIQGFIEGLQAAAPRLYTALSSVLGGAQTGISDMTKAVQELLTQASRAGGSITEDLSFKGMSANLGKFNDQIADMFYKTAGTHSLADLKAWAGTQFGLVQAEDLSWVKSSFYGGGAPSSNVTGLGAVELKVAPGVDSALASLLMNLVRTGQLQLARA